MKAECVINTTDKLIVFSENRSRLTLVNNKSLRFVKVKVDGCQIKDGIKCDYLAVCNNIEHFIELKGQDINHAIEQIKVTISKLSSNPKNQQKICYIICTRSPLTSASIQNFQVKFKSQFNAKLIIKSSPYEFEI